MNGYGIETHANLIKTVDGMVLANGDGASSAGTCERGFRTMGRDISVIHHQLPRLPDGAHGRAGVP